ncbi:MAG: hypothetical protein B7Y58_02435 [Halothiobacillus sp. 35-54-62]|nr:MAG: hypothetical protein B7Y58_02435 [Halothiobacillus sp. 35-54-62]
MRAGGLHRIKPPQWGRVAFLALSGLLTGCAAYRPLVLPQQPEFVAITPAQSTQTIQTPPVLSLTTLQALVLHNNPELKAAKFGDAASACAAQ